MAKLQAICPHCDASFKLKDRRAVGKMVNCPSCSESFKIEAHPVEEEFDDVDFEDDYGADDAYESPYDEPVARPARTRKTGKSKKAKKSDGTAGQIVVFGIAGLMALGFLVAAGFGISYLLKGGDQLDTSYLPMDTEVVVHVKVSELMKSELLKDEFDDLNRPARGGRNMFGFGEQELQPEDIRSVTVGMSGLSAFKDQAGGAGFNPLAGMPNGAKVLAVFKFHKLVKDDFSDIGASEKTHGSTKYWAAQNPFGMTPAFWRASSKVVVVGLEQDVKDAIDRGVGQTTLSKFSFVDGGQDVVFAVRPNDPDSLKEDDFDPDSLNGAPDSLKNVAKAVQEGVLGMAVGANIDTDVKALVQLETDSDSRASDIETNLNSLIDWAKVNLDQYRNQEPKLAEVADAMFANLEVKPRGERVDVSMVFPGNLQNDLQAMPNQFQRMAMGFNQPGFGAAIGNANAAADRSLDKSNLKQIGVAIHNFTDVHGHLPTGIRDANGRRLLSWRVQILPYIEQVNLYEQFNLEEPWNSAQNRPLLDQMPAVLRSPRRPELERGGNRNKTSYIAYQNGTLLGDPSVKFRDVTDGLSNTGMVVEAGTGGHLVEWTRPDERDMDQVAQLVGRGGDGFNVLMGDGAVRFFADNATAQVLRGMMTRSGAEDPSGNGPGRVVDRPAPPVVRPPVIPPPVNPPTVTPPTAVGNLGTSRGNGAAIPNPKVVFTVTGYSGQGDAATAAAQAIQQGGRGWANLGLFAYDADAGEIHVGVLQKSLSTLPAKSALERAGFTTGGVSLRFGPNTAPTPPTPPIGLGIPGAGDPVGEPTELAMTAGLLSAPLPTSTGRTRQAILFRIALTGGDAPKAKAYGMVEVESAKDDSGRDLRAFPLAEQVDFTSKFVNIDSRLRNGVHVYVVFLQPTGIVNSVSAKGKLQLELMDGSKVDVPFDLENVVPAQN